MDTKHLLLSVESKVATVTIHRPDKTIGRIDALKAELSARREI